MDFIKIKRKGFTLIELLVVIAVIGLLATIVVVAVNRARATARQTKAETDLRTIAKAMDMLVIDTGEWPGHQEPYVVCEDGCGSNEIEDLSLPAAGLTQDDTVVTGFINWNGPYISIIPTDPWDNNYFFDSDYELEDGVTIKAVVGSYGPNGQGYNLYDDDDIYYVVSR